MEMLGAIEAAFAGCDSVHLKACELRSEADVSVDDLLRLKRWDYDDLTFRIGGSDDFPADNR